MSEKKHIDRIFQEKLKELNVSPGDEVWGKISQELGKKNDDRKVIPIWWKLTGAAAILILFFTVGSLIFNQNDPLQNSPVVVDDENVEESDIESASDSLIDFKEEIYKPILNSEKAPKNSSESDNPIVESDIRTNNNSGSDKTKKSINTKGEIGNSTVLANQEYGADNVLTDAKNKASEPIKKSEAVTEVKDLKEVLKQNAIVSTETNTKTEAKEIKPKEIINNESSEELIVDQEKEKIPLTEEVIVSSEDIDEEEKENLNRWQVSPNFAPVYFNSFGDGSSIHDQLVYNKKSGDLNLSYGVNVSYAVNKRLSVKSGISRLNLGYSTNDVIIYDNVNASSVNSDLFRNIKLNNSVQSFSFVSGNSFGFVQSPSIMLEESLANLNQDMTFYEIPVELKYRLSDKKVGFSLIGGFSTFLLSDNEVSYEIKGVNTILGEAANLNDVSYSANFGFGLDYKFAKNMSFNLDPTFKYQINTFNNTSGSFKPYFIGVYSGVNIKF